MTKSALTTGDDGACLAEMLLKKCCELREIERCSSRFKADLVNPLHRNLHLDRQRFTVHGRDQTGSPDVICIVQTAPPDALHARWPPSRPCDGPVRA
jgi:GDP-D-mannose dehydratase